MRNARQNHLFLINYQLAFISFLLVCLSVQAPTANESITEATTAEAASTTSFEQPDNDEGDDTFNWVNLAITCLLTVISLGWQCHTDKKKDQLISELGEKIKTLEAFKSTIVQLRAELIPLREKALQEKSKRSQLKKFRFADIFFKLSRWQEHDVLPHIENFSQMLVPILETIRCHVQMPQITVFEDAQLERLMPIVQKHVCDDLFEQALLERDRKDCYIVNLAGEVVISEGAVEHIIAEIPMNFLELYPASQWIQSASALVVEDSDTETRITVRSASEGGGEIAAADSDDTSDSISDQQQEVVLPAAQQTAVARKRKGLKPTTDSESVSGQLARLATKRSASDSDEMAGLDGAPPQPRGSLSPRSKGVGVAE